MTRLEAQIQVEIVRYLQEHGIFCHSIPNEAGGRSAVMQMQLISMGLRPGVADLLVWWPGGVAETVRLGYLELKNEKGKQSDSQVKFEHRCRMAGVRYDMARSVDDVKALLARYRSSL